MYGINVLFSCVVSLRSVRFKSSSTKKLLEFLADMPKANSARIAEAQRQRQNISKKSEKYGPSTVYLQVLGSGARGAPNTLYLFTDQKRYLFNCGECTQRLAHEHKVKLSRLDHIFITNKTWRNIGGLPGLSLTLQDVGVPNITLHGPEGLDELYNATRRFVIMKDMNVSMAKCSPSEDFEDNVMTVKYVLLGPHDTLLTKDPKPAIKKSRPDSHADKEFEEFMHDDTDYYRHDIRSMEVKGRAKEPKPKPKPVEKDLHKKKTEKVLQELQKKTHCSVAYICTLKKRLGTLDLAKCVELGVKPGPLLGQLKSGQDVVLSDGTLVLSRDVKTPDDPGPVFIVLDLPDITYLKEDEFAAHFDNDDNPKDNVPALIVHYTPPHVFNTPAYKTFMEKFGPCTRHLILNTQNACLGSEAVHRTQHKLHLLDPDIFPLLRDVSVPAVWNASLPVPKNNSPVRLKGLEELKNKIALAQFQNIISLESSCNDGPTEEFDSSTKLELMAGRTLTMFHLRPKKQLDRTAEPKLHIQDYIQETMDVDGFVGSLEQFRRLVDSMRYAKNSKEYPKVVFLGTGSCIPSKTRNTSAIVVQIDEDRSMLLDCGEGTFGQLVRFYGPKKVNAFLRTLKAIYISHLHADHHIGLIGVIQAHREAHEEINEPIVPLNLLAPGQIMSWLTMYDQQFEKIKSDFTLIPNQNLLANNPNSNTELTSAVLASIGAQAIQTCLVPHCPNAFGVAIQLTEDYKVTYSGDTLPCTELVKIGENSTLLIHEATMEDELAEEARVKMHSTTTQAIDIGRQMGAKYTVLTHFSQRYARLPRLNAHILNDNKSVGIAFDNMQISPSDLPLLAHMYAPLQLMFAEHCVEMELKAAQRLRHRERRASAEITGTSTPKRTRNHSVEKQERNYSTDANGPADVSRGVSNGRHSPSPRFQYRDSNASRLRQQKLGMTVISKVRTPESHSNSTSSCNTQQLSPSCDTCNTSPSRAATERSDSSIRPRYRPISGDKQERTTSNTPSSTSQSSALSKGRVKDVREGRREFQEKIKDGLDRKQKGPRNAKEHAQVFPKQRITTTGYVVNTCSRTLNSLPRKATTNVEDALDTVTKMGKRTSNPSQPDKSLNNPERKLGYGKPLVTPLNKRLTIRRDPPWPSSTPASVEKCTPQVCFGSGRYSPKSNPKNVEIKERNMPSPPPSPDVNRTLIPASVEKCTPQVCFGSGRYSPKSNPKNVEIKERNMPSPPPSPDVNRTLIPVRQPSSLHRYNESPTRQTRPVEMPEINQPRHRPLSKSPMSRNTVPDTVFGRKAPHPSLQSIEKTSNHSLNKGKDMASKQKTNKNTLHPNSRKSSSGHYTRSFKPQLEDIKSSYLLLHKNMNGDMKPTESGSNVTFTIKQQPFNEEARRKQLMQVKNKFQNKKFRTDSKFDKIEGLNWISWK